MHMRRYVFTLKEDLPIIVRGSSRAHPRRHAEAELRAADIEPGHTTPSLASA